jgi:hypothetical protein
MKKTLIALLIAFSLNSFAQNPGYWQQNADYKIDVSMNVENYQYKGKQTVVYSNNSNDTLKKVYFHLYNNAFQPGSEMDARLQTIADPDGRMVTKTKNEEGKEIKVSRIAHLKPNEIGFLKVFNFKQDGKSTLLKEHGTILEITLATPILPKKKSTFSLDFEGQVPVQIRRNGRNNKEGVELSMAQWYPKVCAYDIDGWHATPYIAREFHGVFGSFDVKITIDKDYLIGGTGYLQNNNEIGFGYEDKGKKPTKNPNAKQLTWHFKAPNVHDFTWAADKDYIHDKIVREDGVTLHFLYKNNPKIFDVWKKAQPLTSKIMDFYNENVGKYPYKQYSVIQGGDGGMEYAMCTLVLGEGELNGFVGLIAHELGHNWFQMVLASNEGKHGWMDEGFASFIEDMVMNDLSVKKQDNPFTGSYNNYYALVKSGKELPLSTHADRFDDNRSYSIASYSKGQLFLSQLIYLIGKENTMKTLKRFYNEYKFKHPTPNDIKRTAERVTGAHLDWYLIDWTQTTNTIDYAIKSVENKTITLERIGRIAMPIDLVVEYTDGSKENFYIPLRMMFYEKPNQNPELKRTVLNDWAWAYPTYNFNVNSEKSIKKVSIDPSKYMADVNQDNNTFEVK